LRLSPCLSLGLNSPRDERASSRELFPKELQFFGPFVCFVVASS
jgi:hypothetical protein